MQMRRRWAASSSASPCAMRIALLAAALTLIASCAAAASSHTCVHDSPKLQALIQEDLARPPIEAEYGRFKQLAVGSLRIVVSTLDLDDSTKYCTAAGQTRSDFQGGTATCTADDVFTTDKKNILLNNILPTALARLQSYYSLDRVTSNVVVPQGSCSGGFTIPSAHSTTGVADADYVLYVAAAPTSGGTIAWAGGCRTDSKGRIVVGRANFGPKFIQWGSDVINEDQLLTAVHELHHALGFSFSTFQSKSMTTTGTVRGKSVTMIKSTQVVAKAREYLGCSTLTGLELEDEGGSGSRLSHWEKRILADEGMCAAGGIAISAMTLAAMEDIGYYTADYSKATEMTWGKNLGCSYINEKCNTVGGGSGSLWCFTKEDSCTIDLKAVGTCSISTYTSALPSHFQYFSDPNQGGTEFFDYCPYVQPYSNRLCTNTAQTPTSSESTMGFFFGNGGRCFATSNLLRSGFSGGSLPRFRCLKAQCNNGVLQFSVGDSSTLYTCTSTGQVISSISGYQGSVTCPDVTKMCASFSSSSSATSAPGATSSPGATPSPPSPNSPTSAPNSPTSAPGTPTGSSTPMPQDSGSRTISGSVTISGAASAWTALVNSDSVAVDNAVRSDIATALSLLASQVHVVSKKTGSLIVGFQLSSVTSTTATQVESTLKTYVSNGGPMPMSSAVFGSTVTMTAGTANTKIDGYCTFIDPNLDNSSCFIYAGITVGGLAIIIIVVCVCCCRKKTDENGPDGKSVNRINVRGRGGREPA